VLQLRARVDVAHLAPKDLQPPKLPSVLQETLPLLNSFRPKHCTVGMPCCCVCKLLGRDVHHAPGVVPSSAKQHRRELRCCACSAQDSPGCFWATPAVRTASGACLVQDEGERPGQRGQDDHAGADQPHRFCAEQQPMAGADRLQPAPKFSFFLPSSRERREQGQ
jgi:hypothetical protein